MGLNFHSFGNSVAVPPEVVVVRSSNYRSRLQKVSLGQDNGLGAVAAGVVVVVAAAGRRLQATAAQRGHFSTDLFKIAAVVASFGNPLSLSRFIKLIYDYADRGELVRAGSDKPKGVEGLTKQEIVQTKLEP